MTPIEHELMEKISQLDADKQHQVLAFVRQLEESSQLNSRSVYDLMKLPLEERNRIVAEALARSAADDTELFEAYGESDFDNE